MIRKFTAFLLLFCSLTMSAKNDNFILRAYTTKGDTSAWVGLDSVAVMISAANDTVKVPFKLLSGHSDELMTDKDGEIRAMIQGGVGKYLLTLDREGYEPVIKEFERKYRDQSTVWIGTIAMQKERHKDLDEIEVVATAIKMVMKGDTIVYNANAFNLAEGSMLDALIRQLPNAQLNANGEITVNGRKISSLLINGKDFFDGDMAVAMKNLPSYTVKNIQVYDKASEDDYLTQTSQKLSRKEDEENLVMDVVLKKEYSIGSMASVEAGYGTNNRWVGKLFGLGFTETFRLSAFGNFNNLHDNASVSGDGYWGSVYQSGGEGTTEKGGLDYMYESSDKKIRTNGNLIVSHEDNNTLTQRASTLFFPTGDLYRRFAGDYRYKPTDLKTSHYFQIKGESVYLKISPSLTWSKNKTNIIDRTATFTEMPQESALNATLNSVFSSQKSNPYDNILLTRLYTESLSDSEKLNASLNINASIRHKNLPGSFFVYAAGAYDTDKRNSNSLYNQAYGGGNPDQSTPPINTDRFSESQPETGKFSAGAVYNREWSRIDEKRSAKINLLLGSNYHYTYVTHDYRLFLNDRTTSDAPDPLPSMTRPEKLVCDALNSYNSTNNDHNIVNDIIIGGNFEPSTRVDSGLNPSYNISIGLNHKYRSNSLDYNTMLPTHELILRRDNLLNPNASFVFSSENKARYLSLHLRYAMGMTEPSINLFLHNQESSNPLLVYENNAKDLRFSKNHNATISFHRIGRSIQNHLNIYASYNLTQNAIGNASIYNPETGVTVFKPMNVDGNWNVYNSLDYYHSFGTRQQITLNGGYEARFDHNVDFHTTVGLPERSLVKNLELQGNLGGSYKFKNGSTIGMNFSAEWKNSHGNREGFREISAMEYHTYLKAIIELPWNMQLRTTLNMMCNSGYDVAEINKAQWLWDAMLSKSIMKGNLTFKLSANDILGQQKPYHITVDSQGRYETRTNTISRYVMLSVLYRFNKQPKKSKNQ